MNSPIAFVIATAFGEVAAGIFCLKRAASGDLIDHTADSTQASRSRVGRQQLWMLLPQMSSHGGNVTLMWHTTWQWLHTMLVLSY